jgi:hypothetical protein
MAFARAQTFAKTLTFLCSLAVVPWIDGDTVPAAPSAERVAELVARPVPFFYDLYTFRGDGAATTVVAAIAVPAGELRRERRDGRVRYRFDVRFVLADTARLDVVNTQDSVFVSLARPLSRQHLLHTYVEVLAQPSASTLQRVIVTDVTRPGAGQLYNSPFPIPDYSGSELMLSDVAFGLPEAGEGWDRNGITLALLPTSQFPEISFDVYYEIYNLPAGNRYATEIAIRSLEQDDDGFQEIRASFSGEAAPQEDGVVQELRRIESPLPAGRYRVTITVRDEVGGRVAQRFRDVDVRGWDAGTTMVPALPYTSAY